MATTFLLHSPRTAPAVSTWTREIAAAVLRTASRGASCLGLTQRPERARHEFLALSAHTLKDIGLDPFGIGPTCH